MQAKVFPLYVFLLSLCLSLSLSLRSVVQKGDRFETECYYDTAFADTEEGEPVVFGEGSEDEM